MSCKVRQEGRLHSSMANLLQVGQEVPPWSDREGQRMTEQMVGSGYNRVRSCAMVRVDTAAGAVGEYNFQAQRPTSSQVYTSLNVNLAFSPATKPAFQTKCLLMLSCGTFDTSVL